ncbi:hypothetical protein BCAR13_110037 [Paraburkholderia caribensis]|nr:hypothetical protein BCAR13_110037 [Paraburkholderia caribensis]
MYYRKTFAHPYGLLPPIQLKNDGARQHSRSSRWDSYDTIALQKSRSPPKIGFRCGSTLN